MDAAKTQHYRKWDEDSAYPSFSSPFFSDHLTRYRFAREFAQGKRVLELACGKGYGSHILGGVAKSVLAVDLNDESLEFASRHYGLPNIEFRKFDVTKLELLKEEFDLVVALEVIEHIFPDQTDAFLEGIKKCLAPDGIALISTPNHEVVTKSGVEIPDFHINNLSSNELKRVLAKTFSSVQMQGQVQIRGRFTELGYALDPLNLRHSLPSKFLRRLISKLKSRRQVQPSQKPSEDSFPKLWSPQQGWGKDEFVFSGALWKQAGMTMAICQKSNANILTPKRVSWR